MTKSTDGVFMPHFIRYKKENSESYALGVAPVLDLLKYRSESIVTIYLHSDLSSELEWKIKDLAKAKNIPILHGTKPFGILSPKENCFAIGVFKKSEQILSSSNNHVVLVNPSNTGNMGTIIRSCLGFGIKDIAIIRPAVDAFDPKCIRASMGAFFQVNIQYFASFELYQEHFQNYHFHPFMLKAKNTLQNLQRIQKPYALIFGNEGAGLPDDFLKVGEPLLISHTHDIDSLNLQTAASLACYEFTRKDFNGKKFK